MSRGQALRRAVSFGDGCAPLVGVTRMDLVCSPGIGSTAQALARRWGEDRALSGVAVERLAALVLAAIGHGARFDPRAVTITLRWLDLDRVRVDVRWHGCLEIARLPAADGEVESTAATLDAFAEDWGFGTNSSGPIQWMVLNTR